MDFGFMTLFDYDGGAGVSPIHIEDCHSGAERRRTNLLVW